MRIKIISIFIIILTIIGFPTVFATNLHYKLAKAAEARTHHHVIYDSSYEKIFYPNGDVADNRGVCADVVIRAYRKLGIDLQQLVHKDMLHHFSSYPQLWGATKPDTNIDHRRVPNLMMFFARHGQILPITHTASDYHPGDIVAWELPRNLTHIGIVSTKLVSGNKHYLIVHNIGGGPKLEDVLFTWKIIGHYRYPL